MFGQGFHAREFSTECLEGGWKISMNGRGGLEAINECDGECQDGHHVEDAMFKIGDGMIFNRWEELNGLFVSPFVDFLPIFQRMHSPEI
jgi:hypothetical protein